MGKIVVVKYCVFNSLVFSTGKRLTSAKNLHNNSNNDNNNNNNNDNNSNNNNKEY